MESFVAEGLAVNTVCQILQIARSSYYRKKKAPVLVPKPQTEEDQQLLEMIKQLKLRKPAWGYRRVRAYIRKRLKMQLNRKRVYRLMKRHDLLVKVKHYKAKRTPQTHKPKALHKNHWWGTDMTKFYINAVGWVYLAIVLDWYSRKIIGYNLSRRADTTLWLEALHMAVNNECPGGSRSYDIHLMSDNGSQPTSQK